MTEHENAPTIPEDEEDDDMFNDDEQAFTSDEALVALLTTAEGVNIASVMNEIADSTGMIAKQLEKQNIILVKILTALTKTSLPAVA